MSDVLPDFWIGAGQVFDGECLLAPRVLRIVDGKVAQISDRSAVPEQALIWETPGCISPGFFDIQVNGGGDVMFNATPSAAGITAIAKAHRQFGTTAILPTVITDAPDVMLAACDAVAQVHGTQGVMGIHIEGPHISMARRGTHGGEFIRPLDDETLNAVQRLCNLKIPVLITVAPEAVKPGQISALVKMGAVVSIGHSDCDGQAVQAALKEGAAAFTHLFNAMSPMLARAPGATGTAINSSAYCSLICDGIHVADGMVGLAVRARPVADRMILISDAMATVGGRDCFELYGKTIKLIDGMLVNDEGTLAGAHTTMARALARMVGHVGVPLGAALRMAITNPARLLGLGSQFSLLGADIDDLVLLDADLNCSRVSAGQK